MPPPLPDRCLTGDQVDRLNVILGESWLERDHRLGPSQGIVFATGSPVPVWPIRPREEVAVQDTAITAKEIKTLMNPPGYRALYAPCESYFEAAGAKPSCGGLVSSIAEAVVNFTVTGLV